MSKIPGFDEPHDDYTGRVSAGDYRTGPHASAYVCDRTECITKAAMWVESITHQEPEHVRFGGAA